MLALTAQGVECLRDGIPASLEREARLRSRLSAAEYAVFCRGLEALQDEAQKLLGEVNDGR